MASSAFMTTTCISSGASYAIIYSLPKPPTSPPTAARIASGKRCGSTSSGSIKRPSTLSFERQHKNSYMYWYNKVKKLQKEAPGSDKLAKVETAFEAFKAVNAERKTAVKDGHLSEKEYIDWLYRMQGEIDKLMRVAYEDTM